MRFNLPLIKVLTTTQPPYLPNVISVQRPRSTRSSSVVTLAWSLISSSLKIAHHSCRYVSPYLFVNLILVPVPLFPTHLFLHPSLLLRLIHHSAHPLLPLSFTLNLKATSFTNPTPIVSLLLADCLHGLLPRLFLLRYFFLGQLFWVDLIKWVWNFRQSVCPQKFSSISMKFGM